jgi:hypothetical protein
MLDVAGAFLAVRSAHKILKEGIAIGKDLTQLSSAVQKWAIGEATLQSQAEVKKNSIFSKLGGAESEGIDRYFKKLEIQQLRDDLRSHFMLYAKNGKQSWEGLQAEIARVRAEQKKELLRQARIAQIKKDLLIATIVCIGVAFFIGIVGFITIKSQEAQANMPHYIIYY